MNNQMTPEMMQALMELIGQGQGIEGEQSAIDRMFKLADSLRGQAPEMRQAGRAVVAPSVVELLGNLSGDLAGNVKRGKAEKRQKDLSGATAEQNKRLLSILMAQTQQPQVQQPPLGQGIQLNKPMGQGLQPNAGMVPGMMPPQQPQQPQDLPFDY